MPKPTRAIAPPAPPLIPARWHGGDQTPALSVIHSTVSRCAPGGARATARYFQTVDRPASAHYVRDPDELIQCVGDHTVAYHCGYNEDSLGWEMTDIPGPVPDDKPGTARWKALRRSWRWARPEQKRMLAGLAEDVARAHLAYGIPIRYLDVAGVRRWDARGRRPADGGITTHAVMSAAFKRSTHWDPGWWPRRQFIRLARKAATRIQHEVRP
ncbi:hypothetical protein GCM10022215_29620 [Nocardioides fonticola]|uniref:N-acetylmuramoyl-L-alanine amidase domain-containing protein n=1 Tax=Nocardioides fonticola TaxID=450363 RepID=A0ABP7XPH1_9ACTN